MLNRSGSNSAGKWLNSGAYRSNRSENAPLSLSSKCCLASAAAAAVVAAAALPTNLLTVGNNCAAVEAESSS